MLHVFWSEKDHAPESSIVDLSGIFKEIREKLIKFATRIPVLMYLSAYREYSLKDVIIRLEPRLFIKVTGLEVKDFGLLRSLDLFNPDLMNDAAYKLKRYEDASLVLQLHIYDKNLSSKSW